MRKVERLVVSTKIRAEIATFLFDRMNDEEQLIFFKFYHELCSPQEFMCFVYSDDVLENNIGSRNYSDLIDSNENNQNACKEILTTIKSWVYPDELERWIIRSTVKFLFHKKIPLLFGLSLLGHYGSEGYQELLTFVGYLSELDNEPLERYHTAILNDIDKLYHSLYTKDEST